MKKRNYMDEFIFVEMLGSGQKLYHYTTVSAVQNMIEKDEFWATRHDFLNDQEEFKYAHKVFVSKILSEIHDKSLQTQIRDRLKKEIEADLTEKNRSGYYVLSFSLNKDNLALWSEFSNEAGYCMGFDYGTLKECIGGGLSWNGKVIYDGKQQEEALRKSWIKVAEGIYEYPYEQFLNATLANISNKMLDAMVESAMMICILYGMFFKKPEFSLEEEYRFVFSGVLKGRKTLKEEGEIFFRAKRDTLIPFIKVPEGILKSLRSVCIGPKSNIDIARKGMEMFCESKGLNVKVGKSKIPLRY
ncbi:MAG: DUF2971 domain-containing protein [Lachnospiraceae bacterium]|nr:DUF2971 domain-containing protein [Lachnospiraceae bacterium]